jgi:hypothetical protein
MNPPSNVYGFNMPAPANTLQDESTFAPIIIALSDNQLRQLAIYIVIAYHNLVENVPHQVDAAAPNGYEPPGPMVAG